MKLGRMAAMGTATASLVLINAIPTAAGTLAPSCVYTDLDDRGYKDELYVANWCDTVQRVKVILANGSDFSCRRLNVNEDREYSWVYPKRFDRLERC